MRKLMFVLPAILVTSAALAEVPGEDHALLPRYAGGEIRAWRAPSEDEMLMPVGRIGNAQAPSLARQMRGTITHIDYVVTPATATAQIGKYYEGVLTAGGFRTVFACVGEAACGAGMGALIFNSGKVAPTGFADGLFGDRMRVIVAQRGDTWLLLHIYEGPDRTTIYEAVVDGAKLIGAIGYGPSSQERAAAIERRSDAEADEQRPSRQFGELLWR